MSNREAVELLPCPFCGQLPEMEAWISSDGKPDSATMISCPGLHPDDAIARCEAAPAVVDDSATDAIAAWNRRTPTPAAEEVERLREAGRIAILLWRNIENGDSRMAKENVACLGYLVKHGRSPSWEELRAAYAEMDEAALSHEGR